jgi:hypothetical protein
MPKSKDILDKLFNPDYEIAIDFRDKSLSREQRLLANLSKLGKSCVAEKLSTPFIRIKDIHSNQILFNDKLTLTYNKDIDKDIDPTYFIDLIYLSDSDTMLYSYLYKNDPNSNLFFNTLYFDYNVKNQSLDLYRNMLSYIININKDNIKASIGDKIHIFGLVHDIQLDNKKWDIIVL